MKRFESPTRGRLLNITYVSPLCWYFPGKLLELD